MKQFGYLLIVMVLFLTGCHNSSNFTPHQDLLPWTNKDAAITNNVRQAFTMDDYLAPLNLKIETIDGNVFISGYVKTIRQSDTAQAVAQKIPGVKSVQNNLIVRK